MITEPVSSVDQRDMGPNEPMHVAQRGGNEVNPRSEHVIPPAG
jgi:hypothetical protein